MKMGESRETNSITSDSTVPAWLSEDSNPRPNDLEHDLFSSSFLRLNNSREQYSTVEKLDVTSLTPSSSTDKVPSSQNSPRLVKNCGDECQLSQRIVDQLLNKMSKLENERAELLAANRSWAVQYDLMKRNFLGQIEKLEKDMETLNKKKVETQRDGEDTRGRNSFPQANLQDRVNVLTHQAEVYKEDFLEERKARVRAHSMLEELKCELKREKKSRAKLVTLLQQQNKAVSEKCPTLVE